MEAISDKQKRRRAWWAQWREANKDRLKEKRREYQRRYYVKHRAALALRQDSEEYRRYQRAVYQTKKEQRRAYRFLRTYGLTMEAYDARLRLQNGCCAICRSDSPNGIGRRFVVDHDHATGALRGLLCSSCNLILGHAHDSRDTLAEAIRYLTLHHKPD